MEREVGAGSSSCVGHRRRKLIFPALRRRRHSRFQVHHNCPVPQDYGRAAEDSPSSRSMKGLSDDEVDQ